MIFIDTGAFVARYLARDQFHRVALSQWKKLRDEGLHCFTTNFVVDETLTLLSRRAGYRFAVASAEVFYRSSRLTILRPDENDEKRAISLLEKYADQAVSFTDCISFVLMERQRLTVAFTFDRHFELAGFMALPVS